MQERWEAESKGNWEVVPGTTVGSRSLWEKGKLAGEPALLVMSKNALQSFITQNSGAKTPTLIFSLLPIRAVPLPYSSIHAPCTTAFPAETSVTGLWFLEGTTCSSQRGGWEAEGEDNRDNQNWGLPHTILCFTLVRGYIWKSLAFHFPVVRFVPIECGHLEASIKQ